MQNPSCTQPQPSQQPSFTSDSAGSVTEPSAQILGTEDAAEHGTTETPNSLPTEHTGATETLADGEKAKNLNLRRGQYRTQFTVPKDVGEARTIQGETRRLKIGSEMKRVHFYKVDAVPLSGETDDGESLSQITAVFRVIDNPIPLVPIAWGAAGLIGVGGGGWLLFSSAETFVEDSKLGIISTAAAIVSVLFAWESFA